MNCKMKEDSNDMKSRSMREIFFTVISEHENKDTEQVLKNFFE